MVSAGSALARRSDVVTHTGNMTWYDVGVGSCGKVSSPGEYVVALSPVHMGAVPNPNLAPICDSSITIEFEGQSVRATVLDTCPTCEGDGIDCSSSLFQAVAPDGDGRVVVDWRFNGDGGDDLAALGSDSQPVRVSPDVTPVQPPTPVVADPSPVVASPSCTTSDLSMVDKAVTQERSSSVATIIPPAFNTDMATTVSPTTTFSTTDSPSWQTAEATITTTLPGITTIAVASNVTASPTTQPVTPSQTTTARNDPSAQATLSSIKVVTETRQSTIEITHPPPTATALSEEPPASNTSTPTATPSSIPIPIWPLINSTLSTPTTISLIQTTPVPTKKPSSPAPYTGKAKAKTPGLAKAMAALFLALPLVAAVL